MFISGITRSINGRHDEHLQQGTGGGGAPGGTKRQRGETQCTANSAAGVGKTPNSRAQLKPGLFRILVKIIAVCIQCTFHSFYNFKFFLVSSCTQKKFVSLNHNGKL